MCTTSNICEGCDQEKATLPFEEFRCPNCSRCPLYDVCESGPEEDLYIAKDKNAKV